MRRTGSVQAIARGERAFDGEAGVRAEGNQVAVVGDCPRCGRTDRCRDRPCRQAQARLPRLPIRRNASVHASVFNSPTPRGNTHAPRLLEGISAAVAGDLPDRAVPGHLGGREDAFPSNRHPHRPPVAPADGGRGVRSGGGRRGTRGAATSSRKDRTSRSTSRGSRRSRSRAPARSTSPASWRKLSDLRPHLVKEIKQFFASYNKLRDRGFRARAEAGPQKAKALVEQGLKRFQSKKKKQK